MSWKQNIYTKNNVVGAVKNPVIHDITAADEVFAETANAIMANAVELVRRLIPSHQSAIALVVQKDWTTVRKYFSMSDKYAAWKDYAEPADGYGIHGYMLHFNKPIRMTQAELEAHPEWKDFGDQKGSHPPMRGWLATPLVDSKGQNWGLMQLSDKIEGEYTEEDEKEMTDFTKLVSIALELAWEKRNLTR